MPSQDVWITYEQAAVLLQCGRDNVAKLVAKGQLETHLQAHGYRLKAGVVRRRDVQQLARRRRRRATAKARRAERLAAERDPRPDLEHDWLSPIQAAERLGVSRQAVNARCRRGTIPAVHKGFYWWIRADLLEQWVTAHEAQETREPWPPPR